MPFIKKDKMNKIIFKLLDLIYYIYTVYISFECVCINIYINIVLLKFNDNNTQFCH